MLLTIIQDPIEAALGATFSLTLGLFFVGFGIYILLSLTKKASLARVWY
jgi:hypothetical protein